MARSGSLRFVLAVWFIARGYPLAADHLCAPDSMVSSRLGPNIKQALDANPGLGCLFGQEEDLPFGNGRFADFANGQIVYSSDQNMVVAGYIDNAGTLVVVWFITDRFTYDRFIVRSTRLDQHDFTDPGADTDQLDVGVVGAMKGRALFHGPLKGIYSIIVEGCDDKLFGSSCKQGWSNPVSVDAAAIDLAHKIDGEALEPADAAATFDDRARIAYEHGCVQEFPTTLNEEFTFVAISKLEMAAHPGAGSKCNPGNRSDALVKEVNDALWQAEIKGEVGTGFDVNPVTVGAGAGCAGGAISGIFFGPLGVIGGCVFGALAAGGAAAGVCGTASHEGDYDMALRGLIPIVYKFEGVLDKTPGHDVRDKVINVLLNQRGGVEKVRTTFHICRLTVNESENHILLTESSRYLTNQKLLAEVAKLHLPGTPEYETARRMYDNAVNGPDGHGLDDWMLNHLQTFMKHDFHEYNARPYQRLSVMALQNLAEWADNENVRTEARMVLDYLAAKFAVGSYGLRRSAPFRRRGERRDFPLLFSNYSDEETWRFVTMAGNTQVLMAQRHGRADWGSAITMAAAGLGSYRVPDLILDVMTGKSTPHFQVFRHEGVELYASTRSFLISAGGDFEEPLDRDKVLDMCGFLATKDCDTAGNALPTVLMPAFSGTSREDLIRIDGARDRTKRTNTCVGPGFACGLNVVVPDRYLVRFRPQAAACEFAVSGVIKDEWNRLEGARGPLGCPAGNQSPNSDGNGTFQEFQRGRIVFSAAQHMVVAGWQRKGTLELAIDWRILDTFHYDFFIVRWDKDGQNAGQGDVQSDDPNATQTSGSWRVPVKGLGSYRVIIEGCDGHFLSSSTCHQSWSTPLDLDLPSKHSCARSMGRWTFIDSSRDCGDAPFGLGFYVAVFRAACDSCVANAGPGGTFGFFEAVDAFDVHQMNFQAFQDITIQHNGASPQFNSDGENTYTTFDGRRIRFTPNHAIGHWGIISMDGVTLPAGEEAWGLAQGDVIDADGTGCVTIKNPAMHKALILDARNPKSLQRKERPLVDKMNCDIP